MRIVPLSPPPYRSSFHTLDNKVSTPYHRYFTNVNNTVNSYLTRINYEENGSAAIATLPVFPSYTQANINTFQNVPNGTGVYNSTTDKVQFREGGAWTTIP